MHLSFIQLQEITKPTNIYFLLNSEVFVRPYQFNTFNVIVSCTIVTEQTGSGLHFCYLFSVFLRTLKYAEFVGFSFIAAFDFSSNFVRRLTQLGVNTFYAITREYFNNCCYFPLNPP